MSDYIMETGAVLMIAGLLFTLDGVVAFGLHAGAWPLWFLVLPLAALHCAVAYMWCSRPSVQR